MHWKYNFLQHLTERHRGWREYLRDDTDFVTKITIGNNEEEALGIPDDKRGTLVTAYDSYDSYEARCMNRLPSIQDHHNDSPHQTRTLLSGPDPLIPLPLLSFHVP